MHRPRSPAGGELTSLRLAPAASQAGGRACAYPWPASRHTCRGTKKPIASRVRASAIRGHAEPAATTAQEKTQRSSSRASRDPAAWDWLEHDGVAACGRYPTGIPRTKENRLACAEEQPLEYWSRGRLPKGETGAARCASGTAEPTSPQFDDEKVEVTLHGERLRR